MELHIDWLELAILVPLLGIVASSLSRNADQTRLIAIIASTVTLLLLLGGWRDYAVQGGYEAHDPWDVMHALFGEHVFIIDAFNAPLLAMAALLFLLTPLATLRTKVTRFPFRMNLLSEFLMLATLACRVPVGVIVLAGLQTVPIVWEMRRRKRSPAVFLCHMGLFLILLVAGWLLLITTASKGTPPMAAVLCLTLAALVRSGCAPLHCWMTDLFEKASLGTALLFVTPMIGAYIVVRILLPVAPDWSMRVVALASLFTAVYAAGMALVQTDARRFFGYLVLSNASLVLVGLEVITAIGLTGALCTWIAMSLSLTGLGLTLRAVESRVGRVSVTGFHGLYAQMPTLATFFLLTGVATVGFPGTVGFAGIELIVEGAVLVYPVVGMAVVVATALNGIAVMRAYFGLFTGSTYVSSFSMRARWPERVAVLVLSLLIIGGGVWPHPGVESRYHAAQEIMSRRAPGRPVELPRHEGPAGSVQEPSERGVAQHTSEQN